MAPRRSRSGSSKTFREAPRCFGRGCRQDRAPARRGGPMERRWPRTSSIHLDPEHGVIEQFDGYFELKDVPITEWDANDMPRYPAGYHHFNCEDTMLLKQPDVIMLMHMLPDEFSEEVKRTNFEYYEARTLHKSSLSPAIHAIMGIEVDDSHSGAAVLPSLRARRPRRQPGQHRGRSAHRLRRRHLADPGLWFRRFPGHAPADDFRRPGCRPNGRRSASACGGGATPWPLPSDTRRRPSASTPPTGSPRRCSYAASLSRSRRHTSDRSTAHAGS